MSLDWIRVSLRGYGGKAPTGINLFDLLALEADTLFVTRPSRSPWQAALIDFFEVTFEDLSGFDEPSEEFALRIEQGLQEASGWLLSRRREAFEEWRAAGLKMDIFVGGWLNNDQFDLILPVEFLHACSYAGLPIQISTNA